MADRSRTGRRSNVRKDRRVSKGMHALVHLQRADGWWDLSPDLASAIGQELAALQAAGRHGAGTGNDSRPWATALAIAWLQEHAAADAAEWQFLVRKARKWLDGVSGAAASASSIREGARSNGLPGCSAAAMNDPGTTSRGWKLEVGSWELEVDRVRCGVCRSARSPFV